MSWRKIVNSAMKAKKELKDLPEKAKNFLDEEYIKRNKKYKGNRPTDMKRSEYVLGMSNDLDMDNDAVINNVKQAMNTPKPESFAQKYQNILDDLKNNKRKAIALGGGIGAGALGVYALSGDEEEQSPDMEQLIESLRQQGLSDEEIAVYLDNMMQAQGE